MTGPCAVGTVPGSSPSAKLATPFSQHHGRASVDACLASLPVSITSRGRTFRPARDLASYLRSDLEPWKIDQIQRHLWYARDRHMPARPLHRHRISRRQIVLTESPSEHLISDYSVVFVKPFPSYLFCFDFWENHLSHDKALHSAASGFVLSYTWLVVYQTDLEIAKEYQLLPRDLAWESWTSFVSAFLDHLDASPIQIVCNRYNYGELRMSRINYLYKFLPSVWDQDSPARGFMPTSMWNKSFVERNIARLLTAFVAFSLILSAMQVGLATSHLQENPAFVGTSYGFAVASLFLVLLCLIAGLVSCIYHLRYKILRPWKMRQLIRGITGHDY